MSLKFLAKKSWNVTNLDNVERVWVAEQAAEKEERKLKELQKQINEERQIQELRELQVKSGQAVKTVDTTLDWMYEGPAAQADQTSEEYLLGKIYQPKDTSQNVVKETAKKPGSLWLNKVSSKNDMFTRLHEDPLLMMKRSEKEAHENVINNPVKMARIRQQLAKDADEALAKKRLKEEKKLEKKKMKSEAKEREKNAKKSHREKDTGGKRSTSRNRDYDTDRISDKDRGRDINGNRGGGGGRVDEDRDRRRDRDTDGGRDRDGDRGRDRDRDRSSGRDERRELGNHRPRSRSRSAEIRRDDRGSRRDTRDGDKSTRHDRVNKHEQEDGRCRSSYGQSSSGGVGASEQRKRRRSSSPSRSRSTSRTRRARRDHRSSDRSRSRSRSRSAGRSGHAGRVGGRTEGAARDPAPSEAPTAAAAATAAAAVTDKKYGLLQQGGGQTGPKAGDYLGPNRGLLDKKEQREKEEAAARQAAVSRARSGQNRQLSAEEKAQKLAEMQQDATTHDQMRFKRQLEKRRGAGGGTAEAVSAEEGAQLDRDRDLEGGRASKGDFLASMRSAVYNSASSSSSASLSDTMSRNKHYQQKGDDLDSHGFMRR